MPIMLRAICLIVIQFLLYGMFGKLAGAAIKKKCNLPQALMLGFFGYYSLFQIVGLILVLSQQSLTLLANVWFIMLAAVTVLFVFWVLYKRMLKMPKWQNKFSLYLLVMVLAVLFVCYYVTVQNYWGWDTAYYIGNVNTSLHTDTMYIFDGNSGLPMKKMDLRYALSMFYMNSAVFCRWTGINAVEMHRYVVAVSCVLMSAVILWLIGKELFRQDKNKSALFVTAAMGLNFFFMSEYTTSQFLLVRSYEAKGYCSNVVIPAIFYLLLLFWKEAEKKENWKIAFIIMAASVPVSMSAILIAPALFVIGGITEVILQKKPKLLLNGIICLIPNGIYLVVYFLYTQGILTIRV